MKRRDLKYIVIMFAFLSSLNSCEDDGGDSVRTFEDGVVPNVTKLETGDQIINLVNLNNGEPIDLQFSAEVAQGEAANTDIVGYYRVSSTNAVYVATLFNNVTLPQDFALTLNNLLGSFSELSSADDIALGDILTVTTRFTRPDGTVLSLINDDGSPNLNSNITNSGLFTTMVNFPVSCPSDLGGTYVVTSTAVGCCGVAPINDREYTVTVTDNGGGSYTISDLSGGIYDGLFCDAFGICGDASSGTVTDICNSLSASEADCCGDNIVFEGTVLENGDWEVSINSGFVAGTSIWVKQ